MTDAQAASVHSCLSVVCFPWRDSLYAGALLAQINEFSFVIAAVGKQARIITTFAYQETLAVIALSLLLSPAWIGAMQYVLGRRQVTAQARRIHHD